MKKLNVTSRKVICTSENNLFTYTAWPTVARLPDDTLAMVTSGVRMKHLCPFGKVLISYSKDEGETWSLPAIAVDTPLDDRDGGLTVFGNGRVMLTTFNNTTDAQRSWNEGRLKDPEPVMNAQAKLIDAYLNLVDVLGMQEEYLGSLYRISDDGGYHFGPLKKSPVTCPHGPCALRDGGLVYIGRHFSPDDSFDGSAPHIECWKLNENDDLEYLSAIENVWSEEGVLPSCEPHAIQLADGRILVHIRVQGKKNGRNCFTIYQSESSDGGRTFTKPVQLLADRGGAPPHLMVHSSGVVICTYGRRDDPFGIRAMFSRDLGRTWDTEYTLTDDAESNDLGYPATVELKDGSLLTVFYEGKSKVSKIYQVNWTLPEFE